MDHRAKSNVLGADVTYGGDDYSAVRVHPGGSLTFNGSAFVDAVDCLNATAYEEDVVVALCSGKLITLVTFAPSEVWGPGGRFVQGVFFSLTSCRNKWCF